MTLPDAVTQGPRAGSNWPAEWEEYDDPHTGARVTRLTSYPNVDDYHLYFTEDGWYDDGRRLLFRSDRTGSRQLFSIDLESGLLTQVTDFDAFQGQTSIHHAESDAYFWVDRKLVRFDLKRLVVTDVLYEVPEGYDEGSMDVNANGSVVYTSIVEDVGLPGDGSKMDEMMRARPHVQLLAVPTDGDGDPALLYEEERWISSHVNASPTDPDTFMFCQEGLWDRVEHRVWVVDADEALHASEASSAERSSADSRAVESLETAKPSRDDGSCEAASEPPQDDGVAASNVDVWTVREVPDEAGIGHEYWMADGERIGYHGSMRDPQGRVQVDDPEPFMGSARYDDTDYREMDLPSEVYALTHTHANSPELHVCDGSFTGLPYNICYRWNEETEEYEGPRVLATVDWKPGGPHPHSRFSPDGSQVLFDSDRYDGSSNLYLVDVPEFENLPEYEPSG